ncbi:interferon-stimulated 20 kDa exonuclease-like 2 isoform X2 [Cheilinus undulatus]|uniref:interferon-stimulated 20 kDa exonuclease-like 2 isoform X2 n=1 Tax=Cheilinus undulatus TaxID=241271 RepID=UPI001BD33D30|nr:interferon-stimulated 20 kDa exonuclease-like 2 isoform X2 [Cheilinus undulatus]XP_041648660.1 interferon-stimulated 20 kDa exonuclease-like 2 isoform X2 [Cheilinus undulatus]
MIVLHTEDFFRHLGLVLTGAMSDIRINMHIEVTASDSQGMRRTERDFRFPGQKNSRRRKRKRQNRWKKYEQNQIQCHNGAPAERPFVPVSRTKTSDTSAPGSDMASAPSLTCKPPAPQQSKATSAIQSKHTASPCIPKPSASTHSKGTPPPIRDDSCLPHSLMHPASTASTNSYTDHVDDSDHHKKSEEHKSKHSEPLTTASTVYSSHKERKKKTSAILCPSKYVAIDCEMVGAGPKGSISLLARCSVVNYDGDILYDEFIKPTMPVTDYRTRWSGIREKDLRHATNFSEAKNKILRLITGKVLVGHALHNDFKALSYTHPAHMTRDTSRIPLLNKKAGFSDSQCASLKRLTKAIFNKDIQTDRRGHSSVEDARAAMELYKVVEVEWENELNSKSQAS